MKSRLKASSAAAELIKARYKARSNADYFKYLMVDYKFDDFTEGQNSLHPFLLEGLQENNFHHLTNLQMEAIDAGILQGRHMLLGGGNGTGKTLAYLLPILNNLYNIQTEQPPTPMPYLPT